VFSGLRFARIIQDQGQHYGRATGALSPPSGKLAPKSEDFDCPIPLNQLLYILTVSPPSVGELLTPRRRRQCSRAHQRVPIGNGELIKRLPFSFFFLNLFFGRFTTVKSELVSTIYICRLQRCPVGYISKLQIRPIFRVIIPQDLAYDPGMMNLQLNIIHT
jgi:hypothetical protein